MFDSVGRKGRVLLNTAGVNRNLNHPVLAQLYREGGGLIKEGEGRLGRGGFRAYPLLLHPPLRCTSLGRGGGVPPPPPHPPNPEDVREERESSEEALLLYSGWKANREGLVGGVSWVQILAGYLATYRHL